MNAARLAKYQDQLKQLQLRLSGDVKDLANDIDNNQSILNSREGYLADEIETDVLLGQNEGNMLAEVSLALSRIDSGSYGVCQGCKTNILAPRLNAIPYTLFCVACEEQHEAS